MDPSGKWCRNHPYRLHELGLRSYDQPMSICFTCKGKHLEPDENYIYCDTCKLEFHGVCYSLPPEIKHSFHPSHPLTLIIHPTFDISMLSRWWTRVSSYSMSHGMLEYYFVVDVAAAAAAADDNDVYLSDGYHKCKCCRRRLGKVYYHCSICNFNLNLDCFLQVAHDTISHVKSHKHPFTLFPIRLSSPCDACGLSLDETEDLVYTCLPCSHMIHKSCIYLPRVIKITRHRHRLSFTNSLISGDFFCGVCRKRVDSNYGRYSCLTGCRYAIHSKCATRKDVWDGKDLEGVPEEPEEDIEPFVRIDDETILHFIHHKHYHKHYLKLQEKKNINEKARFCEACTLPIRISQRFYGCMQCDFVLGEACASLPLKQYLPLHKHPLTLHTLRYTFHISGLENIEQGMFRCDGCNRLGCGFLYKCGEEHCKFQLDVRCAALPDPLIHGCHPQDHPLFFNLTKGNCMGCGDDCSSYFLECMECKSFLGLKCATLPSLVHYKHDRHPLTLCYGEEDTTSGQYWCEICEKKLDSKKWFYTCDTCRITLHVGCLLGKDIYIKPNRILKLRGYKVEIALNDGNSRLECSQCHLRCQEIFVFKMIRTDITCCTITCMETYAVMSSFSARIFYSS